MTIGEKIKSKRHSKNMTQTEIAFHAGVSLPTIVRAEKDRDIAIRVLKKICDCLDLVLVVEDK